MNYNAVDRYDVEAMIRDEVRPLASRVAQLEAELAAEREQRRESIEWLTAVVERRPSEAA